MWQVPENHTTLAGAAGSAGADWLVEVEAIALLAS